MCPYAQQTQHRVRVYMPVNPGKIKTDGDSYYVHAPRRPKGNRNTERVISPQVMAVVAWRYECGERPDYIAFAMQLPRAAVADIIATYEHRARMFFKISGRRG